MSEDITKQQLIEALSEPISNIIKNVDGSSDTDRMKLIADAQKHDLYYRGLQDVVPDIDQDGYLRWKAAPTDQEDDSNSSVRRFVINKVRGDGRKWVSVLGNKAPNFKALPDNPRDEDDIAAATQAELVAHLNDGNWDVEIQNMLLALGLYKGGTRYGYVRWVADKSKYGSRTEEIIEKVEVTLTPEHFSCQSCGAEFEQPVADEFLGQVCPECGGEAINEIPAETTEVPQVVGTVEYPNGQVVLTIYGYQNVRHTPDAGCLDDIEWLVLETDDTKSRCYAFYDGLREKLKNRRESAAGNASISQYAAQARSAAGSYTGQKETKNADKFTIQLYWMRPSLYELIEDQIQRDAIKQAFPEGLKATFVEGVLVDMEKSKIEDHWRYCQAEVSEKILTDAVCKDSTAFQDLYNDIVTIGRETFLRGLPLTIISPDVLDPNVLKNRPAIPAEMITAKAGSGPVKDSITVVPTAKYPDEAPAFISGVEQAVREGNGLMPQLWGGDSGQATATEFVRKSNQALAQLEQQWILMKRFWTGIREIGVREYMKYAVDNVTVPTTSVDGRRDGQPVDLAVLKSGNWHFECDERIPLAWGQQADRLTNLLTQNPQAAEGLGVLDPANLPSVRTLLGLSMLVSPKDDQREKTHEKIRQLLAGVPVQDPESGEMIPTESPDEFEDDLETIIMVVRNWLVSKEGRKEAKRNPNGVENVRAYGRRCLQLVAQQQPQPEPEPGDEPQGEPAP